MKRDLILEQLVIEEAVNLKKYTTSKELEQLDFKNLDGNDELHCIYGQLTGNCYSHRAEELIMKSAKKVYSAGNKHDNLIGTSKLNGVPYCVSNRKTEYFSPIEKFLYLYQSGNKNSRKVKKLVDFLQGKTSELKF